MRVNARFAVPLDGNKPCLESAAAPVDDLAGIDLPASHVFIVENLQTGLAMSDMPGAVVFMRLGYNVDVLARLPWLARVQCICWGDLNTHGFAILHRARSYIPELQSVLMDEDTLLRHKALWVDENEQHPAAELTLLTEAEQGLYRDLKQQRWGAKRSLGTGADRLGYRMERVAAYDFLEPLACSSWLPRAAKAHIQNQELLARRA